VPAIADWIDGDDSSSCLEFVSGENTGVESDYYKKLSPAYKCPNTELQSPDELLLVKGITDDVFGRLCDCVTVYGEGKININTASKTVIQTLSEKIDPTIADMIIRYRQTRPFDNVSQLKDTPAMTDGIYNQLRKAVTVSTDEPYYNIKSEADCNGSLCTINAIIKKDKTTGNFQFVIYKET
jgi:general secretion pathway protein K